MTKTNGFNLNLLDPIESAISKYNHSSLNAIRSNTSKLDNRNFHLEYTSLDQTLKELEKLVPKKSLQVIDIPVKLIKENKHIVAFFSYIMTSLTHYQVPLFPQR